MLQVSKKRYASQQYHDFIGFQVSTGPCSNGTFRTVYGIELTNVLMHEGMAIKSYRFAVSRVIPEMTQNRLADAQRRHDERDSRLCKKDIPIQLVPFRVRKGVGKGLHEAGFWYASLGSGIAVHTENRSIQGARTFKNPTPQTEDMYPQEHQHYGQSVSSVSGAVRSGSLKLVNCDFDSGEPTSAGEYSLAIRPMQNYWRNLQQGNLIWQHRTYDTIFWHSTKHQGTCCNQEGHSAVAKRTDESRPVEIGHL